MNTKYIYIFECDNCSDFYGEQVLNDKGELLCPSCEAKQRIDSPFVEKMRA